MNKQIKTWTASILTVAIIGSAVIGSAGIVMADENALGAKAAAEDNSYTLQEMLTYAIQDEYLAKAEYAAIIDAFDANRPYTRIIRAEENHITQLLPLFEAYEVPVPNESTVAGQAVIPDTLAETFAIGVEAEKNNIAMYEAFLKQDLPDDVRAVFENLRDGSINHQAAFERGASRDGAGAVAGAGVGVGAGSRAGNRAGGPADGNDSRGNRANINRAGNGQADSNAAGTGTGRPWDSRANRSRTPGFGLQGDPENCILA